MRTSRPSARSRSRSWAGGCGEAPAQDGEGRLELLARALVAEGGRDQLGIHPHREQAAFDPLGAPCIDGAPVLREALGVAGVVEIAQVAQLLDGLLDDGRLDPLGGEPLAHLGHRAVAVAEEAVGQVQRVLQAFGVGHAACSIGAGAASAPATGTSSGTATASGSIGWTRSRSMPSAS